MVCGWHDSTCSLTIAEESMILVTMKEGPQGAETANGRMKCTRMKGTRTEREIVRETRTQVKPGTRKGY